MTDAEQPQEMPEPDQETAKLLQDYEKRVLALPVREHIERMLTTLSSLALHRLGLGEGAAEAYDPPQARLAIDAFRALTDVMVTSEPQLSGIYRATLSQMQLAFASLAQGRDSGDSTAGRAESEADAASAAPAEAEQTDAATPEEG